MKKKIVHKTHTKERNWFSAMLWVDESVVRENVEVYDVLPWYKSVRFFLLCFVYGSFLLTAILYHEWIDYILISILFIPIGYFIMRGYRFTFVLMAVLKLYDSISRLFVLDQYHVSGGSVIGILIWTTLWLGLCITAYRVETLRRSKNKLSKTVTKWDKVFFCVLGIFTGLIVYGHYYERTDPRIQLENKYGVQNVAIAEDLYIHLVSIPQFCDASWQKAADVYNEDKAEKVNAKDVTDRYLQRYLAVNEDVLSMLPESLGEDFVNLLGQKTTESFSRDAIKLARQKFETKVNDSDVLYMLCIMLLTADETALKINIK